MNTFEAQILTPEGTLFDGEVDGVQMPGVQGSFEVKTDHASIISGLDVGRVTIRRPRQSELKFAVSGGFVEMHKNKLTLLAEAAEAADKIDVERAQKAYDRARETIDDKNADAEEKAEAQKALARAKNRLDLAEQA